MTVLAHRGLAVDAPENSLAAFQAACDAGADILECDVRATKDGVAVMAHDETLHRVFGDDRRVADVSYAELRLVGSRPETSVISVTDALRALPDAKFNIDVKSTDVIAPLVRAITECSAQNRVLITSFSGARRRRTLSLIPEVATSASADVVLAVVILCALGMPFVARWAFRRTRVLQIPTSVLRINVTSPRMINRFHRAGFIAHFWTINTVEQMRLLAQSGADGLVTDKCDLAVATFRQG
jgi:glycerophosphoryl diester phosphodiesterase